MTLTDRISERVKANRGWMDPEMMAEMQPTAMASHSGELSRMIRPTDGGESCSSS